jgi:magnesium-transporting ATPase (P-type)
VLFVIPQVNKETEDTAQQRLQRLVGEILADAQVDAVVVRRSLPENLIPAPATALAIAETIGLPARQAISGRELKAMNDGQLRDALHQEVLFARTTPEDKLRIVLEKMNVFNFRALRAPLAVVGFFSNRWVLAAWGFTIGLQVCAVYVPFLQEALHTAPLGWGDWGLIFLVALPIFIMSEVYKWLYWQRTRGATIFNRQYWSLSLA